MVEEEEESKSVDHLSSKGGATSEIDNEKYVRKNSRFRSQTHLNEEAKTPTFGRKKLSASAQVSNFILPGSFRTY